MRDLVLWTWVVCGAPLALAVVQRIAEWWLNAIHALTFVWKHAPPERPGNDRKLRWTHP
jgi:hypothetical protein